MVDTAIVGKTLGGAALAAVGATGSINFLVVGFCAGICGGFAIPVAQQFGAGNPQELRRYVTGGTWLCVLFGAVLTATTVIFCQDILTAMNTPADIFQRSYLYIVTIFAGLPAYFLYNFAAGVLRAMGDSRTPVIWLIVASLVNIVLDVVFILTFHMDVFGAAFATVLSQLLAGVGCLVRMYRGFPMLKMEREDWRWEWDRMGNLCLMGLPMGLQYSITAIGSVMIQAAVNGLGTTYVTAVTAASKVSMFVCCPFDAMGSTMATYGGQNVGAAKWERLHQGMRSCVLLGAIYSVVSLAVLYFLADPLNMLFLDAESAHLLPLARQYLITSVIFFFPLFPGQYHPLHDPGHGLLPAGHPGRCAGDGCQGRPQLSGPHLRLYRRLLCLSRRLGTGGPVPGPRLLLLLPPVDPSFQGPQRCSELPKSAGIRVKPQATKKNHPDGKIHRGGSLLSCTMLCFAAGLSIS